MLALLFQVGLSIMLLGFAAYIQISALRQRSRAWDEILAGLARTDSCLHQLSFGSIYSSGVNCPANELWGKLQGKKGMLVIFRNAGILSQATHYIEKNSKPSLRLQRTIDSLKDQSKQVRVATLTLLLEQLFTGKPTDQAVHDATTTYFSLIAHIALAINDYCPALLTEYRYFVMRS